ncbi:DUF3223 domain-containing protein [Pleionea litopenaei]|uniref:Uncharacterized protein n=1 Tax=Pleionea litopenaei TaxID=3070815 RepID=A0AA51RSK1_9GAMM|nr:DUF3223 domain-containing protein [Pleionea sp. HL-JVS1]WMS86714.1 hypothetical protein Q9312_15950 [Pleionea sp. HL-JVS1]
MPLEFIIQGESFNQSGARNKCSVILNRYAPKGRVIGSDFYFLKEAFEKHHYNPLVKIPTEIKKIEVKPSSSGSNHQFWITLESGEVTHIGYSAKCFVSPGMREKLLNRDNVVDAARCHIREQQDKARNDFISSNNLTCSICNKLIVKMDLHADHTPPNTFKAIFEDWIESKSLTVDSIAYQDIGDSQIRKFCDAKLAEDWVDYHRVRFNPQPTHSRCNIAQR